MTVCELNKCTGCMACIDICPKEAITIKDTLSAYNAEIDAGKCVNCNLCHNICQNNNIIKFNTPIEWYQGWASDESIRKGGSSGGIATALMLAFVANGGYVCSCIFKDGQFVFEVLRDSQEVLRFSGSKYVKSNPEGAYKRVKHLLVQGEKVLFIGLPCQVSALKLFVGGKLQINLFTADLICHGTPSPKLLENFLKQYNFTLTDLSKISFRDNNIYRIATDRYNNQNISVTDSYCISFLKSICMTENCYSCQYAKFDRVSDITLGDSWGSKFTQDEVKKGISLILCQTDKGKQLIRQSQLKLYDVNIKNAVEHNKQLRAPSARPQSAEKFFSSIVADKKYNKIVFNLYPKQSFKQIVKKILIMFGLYK